MSPFPSMTRRGALAALLAASGLCATPHFAAAAPPISSEAAAIKAELLALAERFSGLPDPDFALQRQLTPLVEALTRAAPPAPLSQRLGLLAAPWRQIWGPYDYRGDSRGVDPDFAALDEIYQVVFAGGYYYNVTPLKRRGGGERIGLLRGEYTLSKRAADTLAVRFTSFRGAGARPSDRPIWALAADAEADRLVDEVTIVPTLIVRLFFGGGALREVYTDDTLRIAFGADGETDRRREALYVMERAAL